MFRHALLASTFVLGCSRVHLTPEPGQVGTAASFDPMHSEFAADGSWAVLSQADDPSAPTEAGWSMHGPPAYGFKLVLGTEPSIPVERVESSLDEQYLLVERDQTLRLLEVATGTWTDLASTEWTGTPIDEPTAVPERPLLSYGSTRCYTSFAADGRSVAFPEPSPAGYHLVVRTIPDGRRHVIDPGPGMVAWATLMPAGDAVAVGMVIADGGPRAVEPRWPEPLEAEHRCPEPDSVPEGARTVTQVFGLDGEPWSQRAGRYVPMGEGLIRPVEGGFAWWRPRSDTDTTIPCEGLVLHADPATPRMIALCDVEGESGVREYESQGTGMLRIEHFDRHYEIGPLEYVLDRLVVGHDDRFVALATPNGPLVVDVETGSMIRFPEGQEILAIAAGRAMVRRSRSRLRRHPTQVWLVDLKTLEILDTMWARAATWSIPFGRGSTVVFERWLVDLAAGSVVGKLPRMPTLVTDQGRVLFRDRTTKQPRGLSHPRGPHVWYRIDDPPR